MHEAAMESVPYYEEPPSYDHFLQNHLLPNRPALIGPALTKDWRARKEWVEPTNAIGAHAPAMQPRLDYLREHFGEAKVTVADCQERDFNDQKRVDMKFAEFMDMFSSGRYYLKDWHMVKAFPDYHAYKVPDIFADDWMNEYWPTREDKDDYQFVYIGGDSTFTPLHADVYRSYSWSSNICGIKKWTLFPPGQEDLLKDRLNNFAYDIRCIDESQFPNFEKARRIVLYQRDGETLFVPSGWFHQVENIGSTISINHNWSNACNLEATFQSLSSDLEDVRRSIDDVREEMSPMEFVGRCQWLLLLHSGWDWSILLELLLCVSRRLGQQKDWVFQPDPTWQVQQIRKVIDTLRENEGQALTTYLEEKNLGSCIDDIEQELVKTILHGSCNNNKEATT